MKNHPPKVRKLSSAKQRCMDRLLEKNSEGTITVDEKSTLEDLVAEAERLMVANAKRLAAFSGRDAKNAPVGAVPVTVWVTQEHAR